MATLELTRPEGYSGDRVQVSLSLRGDKIIESHASGWHVCPAVTSAINFAELEWLVDNHPNFRNYRRITP